jgi:hypothetical protein
MTGREAEPGTLKQLIGHEVDVDERGGDHHHGRVVNVNRRSIWLLEDETDCIIPLDAITDLRAAS